MFHPPLTSRHCSTAPSWSPSDVPLNSAAALTFWPSPEGMNVAFLGCQRLPRRRLSDVISPRACPRPLYRPTRPSTANVFELVHRCCHVLEQLGDSTTPAPHATIGSSRVGNLSCTATSAPSHARRKLLPVSGRQIAALRAAERQTNAQIRRGAEHYRRMRDDSPIRSLAVSGHECEPDHTGLHLI
jgi:hypothetical protein